MSGPSLNIDGERERELMPYEHELWARSTNYCRSPTVRGRDQVTEKAERHEVLGNMERTRKAAKGRFLSSI